MNTLRLKLARLIIGNAGIIISVTPPYPIEGADNHTLADFRQELSRRLYGQPPNTYVHADSHITNDDA